MQAKEVVGGHKDKVYELRIILSVSQNAHSIAGFDTQNELKSPFLLTFPLI
jgi:hypothetical protein